MNYAGSAPGSPGPEAEIRRLRRRVAELEQTNISLHAKNKELEGKAQEPSKETDELRETVRMLEEDIVRLTKERDEARRGKRR